MEKLGKTEPSPSVRMIKRSKLKELVYRNLEESGDHEHIKPTLDRVLDAIIECRLDSRVIATNKNGEQCLLTLMGSHVYTWHNKELIIAVRECFSDEELYCNEEDRSDSEYILELDEDDKKIFSTN